jgi:hypothetical protein
LGNRHFGVGAVVLDEEPRRAAQEPASFVDDVEADLVAVAMFGARDRELTGQRHRGGEDDLLAFRTRAGGVGCPFRGVR